MRNNLINRRSTRSAALVLSVALALTLSACDGDDSTVTPPTGAGGAGTGTVAAVSAQHNDADITFIQDMTPHHKGALAMAELAPTRAQNADVKQLAERIVAAQGPELKLMQEMAETWDVELAAGGAMSGGMEMGGDTDMLKSLSGAEFDRAFLEMMTVHHEGALTMAQTELDKGENSQAKALAREITESQTAEIEEMKQLLSQL
jgi:uncharacterized protein (DUF305 family)